MQQATDNWERICNEHPLNPCLMHDRNELFKNHWNFLVQLQAAHSAVDQQHDHSLLVDHTAYDGRFVSIEDGQPAFEEHS